MGNLCGCGAAAAATTKNGNSPDENEGEKVEMLPDVIDESCTLGALLQSLMPVVLPIARKVVSKNLVDAKMVLRGEKEVEKINVSREEELLFEPLEFEFGQVAIVDQEQLRNDKEACPEFLWPSVETTGADGFCLDLLGIRLKITFGDKVEFVLPVDGPFGMKANVEIGRGGDEDSDIDQCWMEFAIPRLRLWYSNKVGARKACVAFMERPRFIPNINVNIDRGNGDFLSMDFQEHDGLNTTIETVLCGFGPSSMTKPQDIDPEAKDNGNNSWVAEAIGASISSLISTFGGINGTNAPLEIDLEEIIAETIRIALGQPRPVETIEAELEALKAEKEKLKSQPPKEEVTEKESTSRSLDVSNGPLEAKTEDKIPENCSTGAFFRTLLPVVLPIVRQVVSKNCVDDDIVLKNEIKVTSIDVNNESELVIEPLEVALGNTRVVQLANYAKETKVMKEFKWPKMTSNGFIWDIVNLRFKITWAKGIEFTFPVDAPFGSGVMLEIGEGGGRSDVTQAWMEILIPKLRICYDNTKPNRKAYVIFMKRPHIAPNIQVNADRGKGDFLRMDFQEHDSLDDTIETILCGFGPSSVTKKKISRGERIRHKRNWVADGIGKRISKSLQRFGGIDATDAPLEIDLEETLKLIVDSAMGIPRPADLIDADIEQLTEELKVSKEYYHSMDDDEA